MMTGNTFTVIDLGSVCSYNDQPRECTVGYYLDATIPSAWRPSIVSSFSSWDIGTLCSPHFVRATTAAGARIVINRAFTSPCDPTNDPSKIWYACAAMNYGDSVTFAQHWTITMNSGINLTPQKSHVIMLARIIVAWLA